MEAYLSFSRYNYPIPGFYYFLITYPMTVFLETVGKVFEDPWKRNNKNTNQWKAVAVPNISPTHSTFTI